MGMQFNGERLKKARIYRGLTVAELAEKIDCHRQTLSMYELSKSQPADKNTIEKIARGLRFPLKFFYQSAAPAIEGTVYFRSLLTTNKKYRHEQIIKMEFLSQVYTMLQDYIEFPPYEPISLGHLTPEEAAFELRRTWELGDGPIDNLVPILEQHGILVTTFSASTDDVDAFSSLVDVGDTQAFLIAYSSNKTSAARIHFDVAHELGHICLHDYWDEDIEEMTKEEFKTKERQANEFAAAFLLPESSFKQDAMLGPQTLLYYKQLKRKWKVSIAAMIRRAEKLGVMSTENYQMLIRQMQRRGQRKEEPLDDILMTAGPALLKTSVIMLLQEEVFTPEEFMTELANEYDLSIDPAEVEYLLDLPSGTLAKPKVIDFTALQIKQREKRNGGK